MASRALRAIQQIKNALSIHICAKIATGFYKTRDLKPEDHRREQLKCGNCKTYADNQCYMLKKNIKPHREKYVFFDFETKLDPKSKKHTINYCVAQDFNGNEEVFTNIDEFCEWVFKPKHKDHTFMAHYGKGYDFQFIAEWLIIHGVKPHMLQNGHKIIQMLVKHGYNIRFTDCFSFTLIPLRKFPVTFGLTELAKDIFHINSVQIKTRIIQDKSYYDYDQKIKKDRENFNEWYETTKDKTFDFKQEMHEYCKSDVNILRKGCLKFRNLFIQIANMDPFHT